MININYQFKFLKKNSNGSNCFGGWELEYSPCTDLKLYFFKAPSLVSTSGSGYHNPWTPSSMINAAATRAPTIKRLILPLPKPPPKYQTYCC